MSIRRILISQPRPTTEKSPYFDIAAKYGVEIVFHPFIKVEAVSSKEFRQQKISILEHTAIVFTSRHAIDHFFHLCEEMRVVIPETMKYFCTSESISLYIQKYMQYRKRKIFFSNGNKFEDLKPVILKHPKEKYFTPMSDVHSNEVAEFMDAHKLFHSEGVMYRTVSNEFPADQPFDFDLLVFFTPAGITSLLKNFPDYRQGEQKIGCFGPQTAKAIIDEGLRLDLQAPTPEAPSITAALDQYLKRENGAK